MRKTPHPPGLQQIKWGGISEGAWTGYMKWIPHPGLMGNPDWCHNWSHFWRLRRRPNQWESYFVDWISKEKINKVITAMSNEKISTFTFSGWHAKEGVSRLIHKFESTHGGKKLRNPFHTYMFGLIDLLQLRSRGRTPAWYADIISSFPCRTRNRTGTRDWALS